METDYLSVRGSNMPETEVKKEARRNRRRFKGYLAGLPATDFAHVSKPKKITKEYLLARALRALDMRIAGHSYDEIASELKVSNVTAYHDCKKLLARYEDQLKPNVDHVRRIERVRLDKMLNAIWPRVEIGDDLAIDRALKIMERRAKLQGLDAPSKVEVSDPAQKEAITAEQQSLVALFQRFAEVENKQVINVTPVSDANERKELCYKIRGKIGVPEQGKENE